MNSILTNSTFKNLRTTLSSLGAKADRIQIAVAFLSESDLIKRWDEEGRKIDLIISLRPPTSYVSLKNLQSALNVDLSFLGNDFHSKFFLFYKENKFVGGIIGSSNFTFGGLEKNIETNFLLNDPDSLLQLKKHFEELLENSNLLQPTDLDNYEIIYNNWLARQKIESSELKKFQLSITKNRANRSQKANISKVAKQYFEYWRIVDEIKGLVKELSDRNFPGIPYYLVLDHFWHYIKIYWYSENGKVLTRSNRQKEIPRAFLRYIEWQKNAGVQHSHQLLVKKSKSIFAAFLSTDNIDKLTKKQAKEIFQNLHSSGMPIQRFSADDKFISENPITKIRTTLKYLLYSNHEMDLKIHNVMKSPRYKLQMLGPSGIQEINGWTRPDVYPIRNDKADKALEILGYTFL